MSGANSAKIWLSGSSRYLYVSTNLGTYIINSDCFWKNPDLEILCLLVCGLPSVLPQEKTVITLPSSGHYILWILTLHELQYSRGCPASLLCFSSLNTEARRHVAL